MPGLLLKVQLANDCCGHSSSKSFIVRRVGYFISSLTVQALQLKALPANAETLYWSSFHPPTFQLKVAKMVLWLARPHREGIGNIDHHVWFTMFYKLLLTRTVGFVTPKGLIEPRATRSYLQLPLSPHDYDRSYLGATILCLSWIAESSLPTDDHSGSLWVSKIQVPLLEGAYGANHKDSLLEILIYLGLWFLLQRRRWWVRRLKGLPLWGSLLSAFVLGESEG